MDDLQLVIPVQPSGGSPPHAWGQFNRDQPARLLHRFTPTCVGTITTGLEDDTDVQLWAQFFASARRWPEDKETTEDHILEVDRRVAREFFAHCQSTADKPTIAALNKWARCESEG